MLCCTHWIIYYQECVQIHVTYDDSVWKLCFVVSFKVVEISFYDVLLDFVLLDAFDDLATPPYTVATAVQNRWLSARIKETVCDNKNSGLPVFMHFFTGVCIVH